MIESNLKKHVAERTWEVLEKARRHCEELIKSVTKVADQYLSKKKFNLQDICCVVVGSVGRDEALDASDLDFTPVLRSQKALDKYRDHDQPLREKLRQTLRIDVSKGVELTSPATLDELSRPENIGTQEDRSDRLTRRILILTEGKQAGGKLPLEDIRRKVMEAYSGEDRSRGRHVLSLCNDLTRYYRTLCIEYKSKVDGKEEKWAVRNMKLRHSRKFWFFSCIVSIIYIAEGNLQGDERYIKELLKSFHMPPYQRVFEAVDEKLLGMVGRIIEPFAWFLEFMSEKERRDSLSEVTWKNRYDMSMENPFPMAKFNSDRLHQEILSFIESLPTHHRQRILSWFLL